MAPNLYLEQQTPSPPKFVLGQLGQLGKPNLYTSLLVVTTIEIRTYILKVSVFNTNLINVLIFF